MASSPGGPLEMVGLSGLMERTQGDRQVVIGLVDGPVAVQHIDLDGGVQHARPLEAKGCSHSGSAACRHGTFIAGVLCGTRASVAPGIAPGCSLQMQTVFTEHPAGSSTALPRASDELLADGIRQCIGAGARLVNLSVSMAWGWGRSRALAEALALAHSKGTLVIAAAGNDAVLGSSPLTAHPWVVPVVATGADRRPLPSANLSARMGHRGLSAPGTPLRSLGPEPGGQVMSGSSVAAAIVTGTAALLWSIRPTMSAANLRSILVDAGRPRRNGLVPPFLDADRAWRRLEPLAGAIHGREMARR